MSANVLPAAEPTLSGPVGERELAILVALAGAVTQAAQGPVLDCDRSNP